MHDIVVALALKNDRRVYMRVLHMAERLRHSGPGETRLSRPKPRCPYTIYSYIAPEITREYICLWGKDKRMDNRTESCIFARRAAALQALSAITESLKQIDGIVVPLLKV